MSIHNRYADVPLTEEDFATFDAQFALIEEIMGALQEPDKLILRRVPKLGFKSDTFTRDALMLAAQHEELLPRGLDVQELEAQMALRDALKTRALQMKLMARKMEKIVQILGSDVFSGALAAYRSMKANHRGTMNEQLRELGRLFRNRKKKEAEGPETRDEGQRQHDPSEQPVLKGTSMGSSERNSSPGSDGCGEASPSDHSPLRAIHHESPGSTVVKHPPAPAGIEHDDDPSRNRRKQHRQDHHESGSAREELRFVTGNQDTDVSSGGDTRGYVP